MNSCLPYIHNLVRESLSENLCPRIFVRESFGLGERIFTAINLFRENLLGNYLFFFRDESLWSENLVVRESRGRIVGENLGAGGKRESCCERCLLSPSLPGLPSQPTS